MQSLLPVRASQIFYLQKSSAQFGGFEVRFLKSSTGKVFLGCVSPPPFSSSSRAFALARMARG